MDRIESIILRALLFNEPYFRQVLPFLDTNYFLDKTEKIIYEKTKEFIDKHNVSPSKETILINLRDSGVDGDLFTDVTDYLNDIEAEKDNNPQYDWLVLKTEEWCQEKAIHNAVLDVINILDGREKTLTKGMIPKLLQDALGVSFDQQVGHDFFKDSKSRYNFYHQKSTKIPFHLDYFNKITKNGVYNKTLNICLAASNVGKSLFLCDTAADYLMQGKNVLYITLEMAQERIAERIDANLLNVPLDELPLMLEDNFISRLEQINSKTTGKLIIKEYPTSSAHVGHFRHLLNELWLKKSFKPDAICIDYLNICASSRVRANAGTYDVVKHIVEELRALATENNAAIWTATQMNRSGFNNSDPDATNTSESMGTIFTADFVFALVTSPELSALNQLMVKILKNRYGSVDMLNKETGKSMNKFVIGVDKSKQKLYNLDDSAQDLSEDNPSSNPPNSPSIPKRRVQLNVGSQNTNDSPWETTFDIDLPISNESLLTTLEERQNQIKKAASEESQFKSNKK